MDKIDKNKQILRVVIQMLKADHVLHVKEHEYIDFCLKKLHLTKQDLKVIMYEEDEQMFIPPTEEYERMVILYYLLFAMKADENIDENEEVFLKSFTLKLGIRPLLIQGLIDILKKYEGRKVPDNILIKEIRSYLN